MAFVQIIEFTSTRGDEIRALVDDYRQASQDRPEARGVVCSDRDQDNRYLVIVEFPSYEAAMANSARPETAAMAEALAKLCDGPPTFRNLDVVEAFED
ncbi:MAG TPA: hypothetical protein VFJ85_14545 [Acidimicrobiales bacterium]|nr:hypothetical protein [Acidimicrobiales bacterium]